MTNWNQLLQQTSSETYCGRLGNYRMGKLIGYVMVVYDYDIPEYDIWHMVIDEAEQGRGYGGEAFERVIDYIRTKPFGDSPPRCPHLPQGQCRRAGPLREEGLRTHGGRLRRRDRARPDGWMTKGDCRP